MKSNSRFWKFARNASVLVGVVTLMAVLIFQARNQVVIAVLKNVIEKKIPGSHVTVGSLDLSLGNTITLKVNSITIQSENKKLVEVKQTEILLKDFENGLSAGHAQIKATGAYVDIPSLLGLGLAKDSELPQNENTAERKDENRKNILESFKNFKISINAKKITALIINKDKMHLASTVESFTVKEASLASPFKIHLNSTIDFSVPKNHLNLGIDQTGEINLGSLGTDNQVLVSLNNTIKPILNKNLLPLLNVSFSGGIHQIKDSYFDLKIGFLDSSLESKITANLIRQSINSKNINAKINLETLIESLEPLISPNYKISKDASVDFTGSVNYEKEKINANLTLNTSKIEIQGVGDKSVTVEPSNHKLQLNILAKDESSIEINSKYSKSILKTLVLFKEFIPEKIILDGIGFTNDITKILTQINDDVIFQDDESKINITGSIDLKAKPTKINLTAKNDGTINASNKEGHKFSIEEFEITSASKNVSQEIMSKLNGSLTPLGQRKIFYSANLSGEIADSSSPNYNDEKLKLKFNLDSWFDKLNNKKNTTRASALIAVGEKGISLKDFSGTIFLKDIMPMAPKEVRSLAKSGQIGDASIGMMGSLIYKDGKIFDSKFEAKLSKSIKLVKNQYSITVSKINVLAQPPKNDEIVPFEILFNTTIVDSNSSSNVKVNHLSHVSLNLKKTLELKYPSVVSFNRAQINLKSNLEFQLNIEKNEVLISEIKSKLVLNEFNSFIPQKFRSYLSSLNKSDCQIIATGNLGLAGHEIKKIDLSIKTNSPLAVQLPEKITSSISFEAEINKNKSEFKTNLNLLGGNIEITSKGLGISNISSINKNHMFPRNMSLKISNIKLSKQLIRSVLYKSNPDTTSPQKQQTYSSNSGAFEIFNDIPSFQAKLENSNLIIDSKSFTAKGTLNYSNLSFGSKDFEIVSEGGTAKFVVSGKINPRTINANVENEISNLDLASFGGFLPPIVETISGKANGKLSANLSYSLGQEARYLAKYNFTVSNGEVRKLDLTEQVKSIVKKIDFTGTFHEKASLVLSDKFEKLAIKGSANEKRVTIESFDFIGIKNLVSMKGKGYLGQIGSHQKSEINFLLTDTSGKFGPALKSNTGLDAVPIRFIGTEIDLSPDYKFTLKEVGGGALQAQADKQVKKVSDKLMKQLESKASDFLGNILGGKKKKK